MHPESSEQVRRAQVPLTQSRSGGQSAERAHAEATQVCSAVQVVPTAQSASLEHGGMHIVFGCAQTKQKDGDSQGVGPAHSGKKLRELVKHGSS
jgi:hypothetical protein